MSNACPVCGNEERGQGGYLSCECPAPIDPVLAALKAAERAIDDCQSYRSHLHHKELAQVRSAIANYAAPVELDGLRKELEEAVRLLEELASYSDDLPPDVDDHKKVVSMFIGLPRAARAFLSRLTRKDQDHEG